MTPHQFTSITSWQRKTFPNSNAESKIAHLAEELIEVLNELKQPSTTRLWLEFADCFILLMGAADMAGLSYDDIVNAINIKMEVNIKRKWGSPDPNGVVHHVKDQTNP